MQKYLYKVDKKVVKREYYLIIGVVWYGMVGLFGQVGSGFNQSYLNFTYASNYLMLQMLNHMINLLKWALTTVLSLKMFQKLRYFMSIHVRNLLVVQTLFLTPYKFNASFFFFCDNQFCIIAPMLNKYSH